MRGFTIRLAWIVIMTAFASMGVLIILAGHGIVFIYILKAIGVAGATPVTNNTMITVGYSYIAFILVVSLLMSVNATIDSKNIPIKILSRVIIQNKIFLIADKKVFEKQTIEWTNVDLKNVRREVNRNFYKTSLMEYLYIDTSKIEARYVGAGTTIEEHEEFEEIIMELPQDNDFKLGVDNEKDGAERKKV